MFKRDFERTPQEKARRAQFSIFARLGGCAYLVYIIVQLLLDPKSIPSTAALVFAYVLLAASFVVIGITVYDLIHGLKHGRFLASTYEDESAAETLPEETAEESENALEAHESDDKPDDDGSDASDDDGK